MTACPPTVSAATCRKPQWQAVFRQMTGLDLIRPDAERHGAFA
jgi:hypothetical protein